MTCEYGSLSMHQMLFYHIDKIVAHLIVSGRKTINQTKIKNATLQKGTSDERKPFGFDDFSIVPSDRKRDITEGFTKLIEPNTLSYHIRF